MVHTLCMPVQTVAIHILMKRISKNQAQLDAYNAKHGTNYIVLPKEMYDVSQKVTFLPRYAMMEVPIYLKNIKFSLEGNYALPIKIIGRDVTIIKGQDETLLVLEQQVNTKALRVNTNGSASGSEDDKMFPNDFKVDQWTMEVMVNPDDDNILLYYPLNGKKRDSATGTIIEDETMLWDWSKNGKNLPKPSSYTFDDNKGDGFIFPPLEK